MADNKINVGGRLHSVATGNILAGADEILDDNRGKKQSEVNIDVDNALANRYTKDETYNKNQLNNLITTPNQKYVTVEDYASLPKSGETDTIYRVSNWDGSLEIPAVDITKYSEYAWDGTGYVLLCVKTQIGEVYDISAAHSGAKYADLSAALGVDGGNVPSEIRRGGISVKFVQSFDNNYIQARLMANSFTTDVTKWQTVDAEPTAGSENLVKSGGVNKVVQDINLQIGNTVSDFPHQGFISNQGTIIENTLYYYSDKIKVSAKDIIKIYSALSGGAAAVAFYGAGDSFISSVAGSSDGSTLKEYDVIVPDNAKYAIFTTSALKKDDSYYVSLINSISQKIAFNEKVFNNVVKDLNVYDGYITKNTGVIVNNLHTPYKYIKVSLQKGYYLLNLNYDGTQVVLAKYTDNTYSTLDRIIINNKKGNNYGVIFLEEGYYAVSCNNSGRNYYLDNDISLVYLPELYNNVAYENIGLRSIGQYISDDGVISCASDYYIMKKVYLESGYYYIDVPYNIHPKGARYTDESYGTLAEIVAINNTIKTNGIYYLPAGYYAFCSKDSTPTIIPMNISILEEYQQNPLVCVSKYITEGTGVIASATDIYLLSKIFLSKGTYFLSVGRSVNTARPRMWKYSDATYATPVKQILEGSSKPYDAYIDIDEGYYAICNRYDKGAPIIIKCSGDIDSTVRNRIKSRKNNKAFESIGLDDLVLANATITDGVLQISSGGSATVTGFQSWYWKMTAKILATNNFSVKLGKEQSQSFRGYITLALNGDYTFVLDSDTYTGNIGFALNVDEEYSISLEAKTEETKTAIFEVIGSRNYFKIEKTGSFSMFGYPKISTETNCTVKDFSLSIQNYYDIRNLKVAVFGHSFVESNSLGANRIDCFTHLLAEKLGEKCVANLGHGGSTVFNMFYEMDSLINIVSCADYIMICIGANDSTQTSSYIIRYLKEFVQKATNIGATPILFTIAPFKYGFVTAFTETNQWIRNSGYRFVDMEKVFLNQDGTINKTMYLDNIHPTVDGHKKILNRIMIDCPYLF